MTKPTPQKRKDASRLKQDIVDAIVRKPKRSIDDLAKELGFGDSAVRLRVTELHKAGFLSFIEVKGSVACARLKLWSIADGSELPAPEPLEKKDFGAAAMPRQATTRKYPPVNRRDPLVAAMFGPAGHILGGEL